VPTFHPAPGVLAEQIDGRALLIDAGSSELVTLNPVGSVVWEALRSGLETVEQLVAVVASTFEDAPADLLEEDVAAFLAELVAANLVVTG
jgi:Coenzyme PQQ synthesis protein D (PqqD)